MAFLPIQANINVDDAIAANAGGAVLIPEGVYHAVAVSNEIKDTQNGQAIVVKFVLTSGQYEGTEFEQYFNIINTNPLAEKIAYADLAKFSKAVGFAEIPTNGDLLMAKPFALELKTQPAKPYIDKEGVERTGSAKSVVKGYKAISSVANNPAPVQAQAVSPAAALPWKK